MTTLYYSGPGTTQLEAVRRWDWERKPIAVLVSFAYLRQWGPIAPYFRNPRALMLDSGAFTMFTSGKTVNHDDLIAEASKPVWTEAIGLDVIGDWKASKANADYEAAQGATKMIPTFHIGDPWDLLKYYCDRFPKVGIGGMVGAPKKLVLRFLDQVFARAWPKRLHAFGRCEDDILIRFPFESADAATWAVAPTAFRNWMFMVRGRFVQKHLSVEGTEMLTMGVQNHMEVMWEREQRMIEHWRKTLAPLQAA